MSGLAILLWLRPDCLVAAADCFPAPSGMVSWWPGDGNAGDIAGTNSGTLQGGATANGMGVIGSAFSFDGTNSYVQIPDSLALKPANLTIEAWVNFSGLDSALSGTAPAGDQYIVFKQNSQTYNFEGYSLEKYRIASGDAFMFTVGSASGQEVALLSKTLISTSVWYHVAAVRGSNFMQLYVNGQLEGQTNVGFAQDYGTLPLYFGTSQETYWDGKFKGRLDEVSLYNRALPSNDIAAIYMAGAGGRCKGASISVQPQGESVVAGSNALLTVTATGFGLLNYQWQFNGVSVVAATNTSLALTNVQTANAGSYTVVVTNTLGSVTSAIAVLTVLMPASIMSQPQSRTNFMGSDASFSVTASGTPTPTCQWQFDGAIIPGATGTNLLRSAVQFADAGAYRVVVTNVAGSVTSAVATLTVACPALTLSPATLANGTAGVAYSQSLGASGGAAPYTFSVVSSNLPTGLTLSSGGVLSGTPTAPGSFSFSVRAVDTNGCAAINSYALGVGWTTETPVSFPDPGLEAAIRCTLGLAGPGPLTSFDLERLTCLWACGRNISNLTGLEFATNLTDLYLNDNSVSNIANLQGLGSLRSLELDKNCIASLSPLAWLTNLTCLVLGSLPVADYSPLACLTNLTMLTVREGTMISLTNLQNLTRLTSLKLWQNGITDISSVSGLTNLTCLDLRWNSITNLCFSLTGLTHLTSLYLGGNCASSLPPLQNLSQLTLLNLDDDRIADLSPLTNLSSLRYLAASRIGNPNLTPLANLSGLVNLELRGNSVSNLTFLSNLSHLNYADLAYNNIKDLAPLTNMTSLNSLVLGGNPITDYSPLGGMPNLTNLWLFDNAITNANFLANLPRLNHLNLDQNRIADIGPLRNLVQVTGVGLSRNPITNYAILAGFSNLTSLRIEGNCISEADLMTFLPGLGQLTFVDVNHNRLADLSPLAGLTNCQELYLRQNRLRSITNLSSLLNLLDVDLTFNALDLTADLRTRSVIGGLQCGNQQAPQCQCGLTTNGCRGMRIRYWPQNEPPTISVSLPWGFPPLSSYAIACSATSSIPVRVPDYIRADGLAPCDALVVTADSSDSGQASVINNFWSGTNGEYLLSVKAGDVVGNRVGISVVATDETGLSSTNGFSVTVVCPVGLSNLCPNLDSNLLTAISSAAGKSAGDLTSLDLLHLTSLAINNSNPSGFCGWPWLTNVTSMFVDGNSVTNLSFLMNLPQLSSLVINNTRAADLLVLDELTNLVSLSLYGDCITNLTFLTNLTRLSSLTLYQTRVTDLSPLAGLTNIRYLHLQQNRLTNISSLTNLAQLLLVDVSYNLLDVAPGSAPNQTIQALGNGDVSVIYLPQRQPPMITMNTSWAIAANVPSWLYFVVSDNAPVSVLSVTASAGDTNLIPNTNLVIGNVPTEWALDWFLEVTPANNRFGTTMVTLTAANDAGLSTNISIVVTVNAPLPVDDPVFTDTNVTSWVTSTNFPWFGQTNVSYAGLPSAQSASITDNGSSWLNAAVTGPGILSFRWKVSSEWIGDCLKFSIDGNEQARISGEVDWQREVFGISPGPHTLRWDYSKDSAASAGMDAGWVAQVSFLPASWLQALGPSETGQFRFTLYGVLGRTYQILASTNTVNWVTQATVVIPATNSTGTVLYTDSLSPSFPRRFYRARQQP
jgi:internalin A